MADAPDDSITLLRNKQLAAALGVSLPTLWRIRHELPPKVQISRGISGWRRSDISAWMEKRTAR